MALTDNGHGDVCKYYSYDMHQMIPDILIGNIAFLDSLPADDRAVFEEGFALVNRVEREEWTKAVENAKKRAAEEQGVQFNYPDTAPFQQACAPLHESMLERTRILSRFTRQFRHTMPSIPRPAHKEERI